MYIDQQLCKRCMDCRPVCPMGAIGVRDKRVVIDEDECVECGVCLRFGICQQGAIKQPDHIPYPRVVRAAFSDPLVTHKSTGIGGRGTEEMKTNDVTNHYPRGKIGFSIEVGRPGVGTRLKELDKVTRKVTSLGVQFAEDNPVRSLMEDPATGALKEEIQNEKVLSAIVEFLVNEDRAEDLLAELREFLDKELDTVATVSIISRADERGDARIMKRLRELGFHPYPNGKVNIGLARVQ